MEPAPESLLRMTQRFWMKHGNKTCNFYVKGADNLLAISRSEHDPRHRSKQLFLIGDRFNFELADFYAQARNWMTRFRENYELLHGEPPALEFEVGYPYTDERKRAVYAELWYCTSLLLEDFERYDICLLADLVRLSSLWARSAF